MAFYVYLGLIVAVVWVIAMRMRPKDEVTYEHADPGESGRHADTDAWEGTFFEAQRTQPCNARLHLNYQDGEGKNTERSVHVRAFGEYHGTTLLIGHCALRDATRTFRTDRIARCIDEETGEVVRDVRAHLEKKSNDDYDPLRILYYVGKADGQLRMVEKAIIRDVCDTMSHGSLVSDVNKFFAYGNRLERRTFELAVDRMAGRDETSRRTILSAAEKIVATQKSVHPAEQEALDFIRRRLAGQGASIPVASSAA